MTTIARGDIEVNLNDAEVIAGLRAVDSQFDRTMRKIEHSRAEATIDAKLRPLEQKLEMAKAKLREYKGQKAEARIGANTAELDRKILLAERAIKRIDGRKATIEMQVRGDREALQALQRQGQEYDKLARAAESASKRQQQAHYRNTVGIRQEAADVAKLQQQYARLTDRLERITSKRPIGREARAKVELDAASTILQMEALKAKLNALGAHPPIDIKADIDRGAAQRLIGFLASVGNKAAKLSDLTVRLGPFTTSIKGMITALGFLGPTITDLLGATGALIGTLGAGLAGAATISAGALTGAAMAGLGLAFSLRNTKQEVTNARTAINGYQKAVEQYGKNSDQAKKKQQAMNNTLASISPLARETALGVERFFRSWDKGTQRTQKNLGRIAHAGFQALDNLTPMWARRTNQMSTILADALTRGFKFLGRGPGKTALDSISKDFNAALPTLLQGLGAFGHGFLNIAVQGAHAMGMLTGGIDSLGQKFLAFTQRDNFGQTIHSWVMQARDLMRFFGALTRVMVHFFGAGSRAGQEMVQNMTNALNRWDKFLTSTGGRNRVAQGFQRAADGATALWHALSPLVGAFVMWANNLSPFVTGVVQGISFVSRLTAEVTKLLGLGGPLATLGATMGAMWAVGKIGAFVSILARVPGILKEVRAAGSLTGMAKAFGGLKFGALGATGIEAAGRTAAAEMQAAIVAGGAEAAAEMRGAMIAGGAAAAAEEAGGAAVGGAVAGAEVAGGAALVGAEAAGAATAVGGLTIATGGLILVGAAAAVGLGILASKLGHGKTEVERLTDALKSNREMMSADNTVINGEAAAQDRASKSRREATASLKELRTELAQAKPGSLEYRDLQLRIFDATQKRTQAGRDAVNAAKDQRKAAQNEINDLQKQIDLTKQRTKAKVEETKRAVPTGGRAGGNPQAAAMAQARASRALADGEREVAALQARITQALNARAAATLNVARAQHGLNALTGASAQAAGALSRTNPNLAQNIALKYASPKNVGDVSTAARRALGQGVSVRTVLKVIADTKDADSALRRLRSIEVNRKMVNVGIAGHNGVLSKLSQIDQKAIRQKIARIIQHGGEPTLAMIQRIIQRQIRDKGFKINAEVSNALAAINLVAAGLSRIQSKSIVISARHIDSFTSSRAPGAGHASGRWPQSGHERALIGEGRGPEHYIDPARGVAFKTNGPMVMDISPSAFIIPTEDAYKQRGRDLLSQAAADLGMNMYKKGKKKAKGKGFHKLPIARGGSLKTDYFVTRQSETQAAYNRNATQYNNAHKQMGTAHDRLTEAQRRDKAHHTAATGEAVKKARKAYSDAKKEFEAAKKRNPGLDKARKDAQEAYQKYATDQNMIEKYTNDMNTAATKFNTTGDSKYLDAWNTAKSARQPIWDELVGMIAYAKKHAGAKWGSELDKMLSGAQSDQASAEAEVAPSAGTMTLEDFIASQGLTETLTQLNTNLSVAGLTPDVGDDRAAGQALVDFYTNLFGSAQASGNVGIIGQAAEALKSARDTLAGLNAPTGQEQAVNDQLKAQLYNMQRTNAANEAYISTALGPGDIGAGTAGAAAAGNGPVININTLHPGDPATLRAIGDAATSGMGYQPSVSSSTLRTGM